MENKKLSVYDVMEEKLKDDTRSLKEIKNLGKELISKIKMIDEEINIINPEKRINWSDLPHNDSKCLIELYKLKGQYRHQFDMICIVLNKENKVINSFTRNKFEQLGLSEEFLIKDL